MNYVFLLPVMVMMNLCLCLCLGFTVTNKNLHRHRHFTGPSTGPSTASTSMTTTAWNSLANMEILTALPPSSLTSIKMIPSEFLESSSLLQAAVEVFDGSTIADPVVVSGVFWSSLKTKIFSVIIGQFLATAAFGILAYLLSSQLSNLSDYLSKNLFQQKVINNNFEEFTQTIKDKSQSPTITPDFGKLILCLVIDVIGTSSELIPFVGEVTDIVYAPVAALALRSLFQGSNVVFALEFLEEILPFTDILPLATICWVVETYYGDSDIAKTLQIGLFNNDNREYYEETGKVNGVIDAKVVQDEDANESNKRLLNEQRDGKR